MIIYYEKHSRAYIYENYKLKILINLGLYDFMINFWTSPNAIVITRDPVRKKPLKFAVQCRHLFAVDRECINSGYIY